MSGKCNNMVTACPSLVLAHIRIGWVYLLSILVCSTLGLNAAESPRGWPVPFEVGNLWGYRYPTGDVAVPPRFYVAKPFTADGSASAAAQDGWVIIGPTGEILLRPFTVDNWPDPFSDGLARFVENGKIGFFDPAGRRVIPAQYDAARPFSEGLAAVCRDCREKADGEHTMWVGGRWGYVNRTGKTVIPMRFEDARPFVNGRAEVRINGRWRVIDRDGESAEAMSE